MQEQRQIRQGKWRKTEKDRFMVALHKYGKNWEHIQTYVQTRSVSQIKSHAQKIFREMDRKEKKIINSEIKKRFSKFCQLKAEKQDKHIMGNLKESDVQNYANQNIEQATTASYQLLSDFSMQKRPQLQIVCRFFIQDNQGNMTFFKGFQAYPTQATSMNVQKQNKAYSQSTYQ